jgi:omega-6 fatty acid desaturase (delta-12 desaturase)
MIPTPNPPVTEVRSRIDDDHRGKSIRQGLFSFFGASAFWLLTLIGIALLPWWAKIPLAVLNGLAISVIFVVGHDAGHGSLFPIRWMNRLAGRIALLPALHPFTAWVHNHNGLHHGFTNIKEKDPGFPPLDPSEYAALNRIRRWHYRACRTGPGLAMLYFTDMWLKWEFLPNRRRAPRNPRQFQIDRLVVIAFAIAWIGSLAGAALLMGEGIVGVIVNVLLGFVVPYGLWNWFIAFMIFQQHTHPRIPWYSALDEPSPSYFEQHVRATPHIYFPGPLRYVMRHIMEHTAHHADPAVPLYHLPTAQKELERVYRREMVRVIWSPAMFRKTLKTCRLYDYAAHRWVDYDGTPLTPTLIASTVTEPAAVAAAS